VLGPLLENFVLGELARQLGWAATRATLRHDRTRDGVEVDAILEAADGRIVGIEVTSAETVRGDDFSGVRHLQARVPERFLHGLVLYAGSKTLPFGDRLLGAPIDALWCAEDKPSSPWHSVRVIAPRASRRLRRARVGASAALLAGAQGTATKRTVMPPAWAYGRRGPWSRRERVRLSRASAPGTSSSDSVPCRRHPAVSSHVRGNHANSPS